MHKPQIKYTLASLLTVALILLAGCSKAYEFHGTVLPEPPAAAEIIGTNWDGETFHLSEQQGKVVVAFFGYTHCPDVCPMTLVNLNTVYKQLGEQADKVAIVFIATDPDRDTPEQLATYVQAFNPAFYGVYIPEPALGDVKKAYGVYAEKNDIDGDPNNDSYFIDHTGYIYVIDAQGNWRLTFPFDAPVDDLVADVQYLLND